MSTARQKARARIKQLREMTAERGCTEAEALAAAAKAAQLMLDHGISEADVVIDLQRSSRKTGKGKSVKAKLWPIVAACTNTVSAIVSGEEGEPCVAFIGREPGPEIAVYLRDVCERAIDRQVREFKRSTFYRRRRSLPSKRAAVSGFVDAMIIRLGNRLWGLFGPQYDQDAIALAIAARDERLGQGTTVIPRQASMRHDAARDAGWHAANAVNLARGLGNASPLAIGSRS